MNIIQFQESSSALWLRSFNLAAVFSTSKRPVCRAFFVPFCFQVQIMNTFHPPPPPPRNQLGCSCTFESRGTFFFVFLSSIHSDPPAAASPLPLQTQTNAPPCPVSCLSKLLIHFFFTCLKLKSLFFFFLSETDECFAQGCECLGGLTLPGLMIMFCQNSPSLAPPFEL